MNVFGLTGAVLHCDEQTTLDDFGTGILVNEDPDDYFSRKSVKSQGEVRIYDGFRMTTTNDTTSFTPSQAHLDRHSG